MRSTWPLILLAVALLARPAAADDVRRALAALHKARSAADRLEAIPGLAATGADPAAAALARLVADDPDLEVRVRAAQGLGRTRAESAPDLLLERLIDGGPLAVRDAVAWALARKPKAARLVTAELGGSRRTDLERGLLLRALGAFRDAESRSALLTWSRDADPYLRAEAVRALCARAGSSKERTAFLRALLAEASDAETLLPILDALEPALTPALRPALERLTTFLEPAVADAADHLLRVLDARLAKEVRPDAPAAPDDRYGTPEAPPPIHPPTDVPSRSRHDLVYLIDATGSTVATLPGLLERIRHEVDVLVDQGLDLRIGVIAYRGGRGVHGRRKALDVLPPTYDPAVVRAFLEEIEPSGVDDRGASVALALRLALDRMGWRRGARRAVKLIADGPCEDPADAIARAGIHYREERTRTRVAYVLRTRGDVPDEYDRLAQAGGTGAAETIE